MLSCLLGVWGSSARELIRRIGSRVTEQTGDVCATQFLIQQVSINVQRGNVASVMATIYFSATSVIGFWCGLQMMT